MNTLEYHNPDNVTPEQVGEGWRLCLKSEVKDPPKDAVFFDARSRSWELRVADHLPLGDNHTYRTRAPLPESQFNCPPIKIGKEVPPSQDQAALAAKMQEALSEKSPVISDGIPEGCLPFDLEKAKAGAKLRLKGIQYDNLVGSLVDVEGGEACVRWSGVGPDGGKPFIYIERTSDLFLLAPRKVKREGWVPRVDIYKNEAEARSFWQNTDLVRVEWEEEEK